MNKSIRINKNVKGFSLVEVLVSLALTSIAITLAYATLAYVQKLFYNYRTQNKYLTELISFQGRLHHESESAITVWEEKENLFIIRRDSTALQLEIKENVILMRNRNECDTFHLAAEKLEKKYETLKNPLWTNKLLKSLSFQTEFSKQKFNIYFYKDYDSYVKMELENSK